MHPHCTQMLSLIHISAARLFFHNGKAPGRQPGKAGAVVVEHAVMQRNVCLTFKINKGRARHKAVVLPGFDDGGRLRRIEPVSYTHLDVYKRQAHPRCNRCRFFASG